MKIIQAITVIILLTLGLFACKKNKPDIIIVPPPNTGTDIVYPSYSNLATNSYWIYQGVIVNAAGEDSVTTAIYDSVYIDRDTMINRNTYYKLNKPEYLGAKQYVSSYLRDSAGYIVDKSGIIQFSATDFKTVFRSTYLKNTTLGSPGDSLAYVEIKMADKDKVVNIPAGRFITSSLRKTWKFHPYFARYGPTTRVQNTRYSAGIGVVSETLDFYLFEPWYTERRLVRYGRSK